MFGLEFSGISDVPSKIEQTAADLESLNAVFFQNLETGREAFELTCAADRFRSDLQFLELSAISRDNPNLFKKLSTLRDKSYKVTSPEQLEALKKQLEQIKSSQASLQAAKTAQAEIAVKQAAAHRKPIITDVSKEVTETVTDTAKKTSQITKTPATKIVMDEAAIKAEAATRTQAQQQAAINAEKAQKFYSSLSDAATGKSAAESAKVFEEAAINAEAQARTQAQQQAAINAQKAQEFYSSLSDAATGKSAAESAAVFEEAAVKAEAAVKKPITPTINNADDIVKNNKNLKDSILKVIKSKKFKYGAIAAAIIIAGTIIFTHLKKKNEKKHNLNTVK